MIVDAPDYTKDQTTLLLDLGVLRLDRPAVDRVPRRLLVRRAEAVLLGDVCEGPLTLIRLND